jgi:hypothetical protein
MSRIDELVAALDGHEVTDSEGEITEETETSEEPATALEENDSESDTEETDEQEPAEDLDEEVDEVEDESGKKYIPIDRFNKIYGKMKTYERQLQDGSTVKEDPQPVMAKDVPTDTPVIWDKADVLEVKLAYPQFDPKYNADGEPTNTDYSLELDELAFSYLQADPRMTPMKAAQKALKTFEKLTKKEVEIRTQAKKVKLSASEAPLTSRNRSRGEGEPDPDKMSFKEKEEYLRSIGYFG